jgi:L-ascorbate metabolism protein UlaG (beta-lactamase superfamily)
MIKRLFVLIFSLILSSSALAEIKIRWLSVASVIIEDGDSSILVDPDWTRPNLFHVLGFSKLVSNEGLVKAELEKLQIKKVSGIFTSHSHFDHAIDAPIVARLTDAINYVDESSLRISNAYKDPRIKTMLIKAGSEIPIGKFRITPMKREHSPIGLIHMHFLPGPVPEDFDFGFWQYKTGDTWFYLIEHPEKTILLDQGSASHINLMTTKPLKVDVLIQGVANRENDQAIVAGYLKEFRPSVFIPLHFDNFFKEFDGENLGRLFGIKLDPLLELIHQEYPQTKVINPHYGEVIIP